MEWLAGIVTIAGVMKELVAIGIELAKFVFTEYENYQRAAVLKEIRAGIQESSQSMDNTRLMNVFDPRASPFPRALTSLPPTQQEPKP